ncbi:hypothetical protein AOC36_02560 [Erysipelothrix larvae]|uniref:Capsule biosynthesis protein CapG n=1 Tax=Erysipelothrix larvae TaxID=1514105 RepID=A0A0X8GYR8_9FIRM|nr:Stealth CR1 domain-containing protein [Erysipelothrix larvae]AMC92904.1 hypothetical protein AOC36_02560 [Erysipelothrix larvae]
MNQAIDFVVMWVDGNDPIWREKKKHYKTDNVFKEDDSEVRYRDWDNLEIWLKSVETFAPWVRNVFIITDNQQPKMNGNNPKVRIVDHKDFIPEQYLPVFSANPIELNVHRIEGLSEQFVLFNDDMFLIRPVAPTDFFDNGNPKDMYGLNVVAGIGMKEIIQNITLNDVSLINAHFNKGESLKKNRSKWYSLKNGPYLLRTLLLKPWGFFTGFVEPHVANSYLKSTFEEVWTKEYDVLDQTCYRKFRNIGDVNQWLIRYWQLASGISVNRNYNFGKFFDVTDENVDACAQWIMNQKSSIVCINDKESIRDFESVKNKLNHALESVISMEGK